MLKKNIKLHPFLWVSNQHLAYHVLGFTAKLKREFKLFVIGFLNLCFCHFIFLEKWIKPENHFISYDA